MGQPKFLISPHLEHTESHADKRTDYSQSAFHPERGPLGWARRAPDTQPLRGRRLRLHALGGQLGAQSEHCTFYNFSMAQFLFKLQVILESMTIFLQTPPPSQNCGRRTDADAEQGAGRPLLGADAALPGPRPPPRRRLPRPGARRPPPLGGHRHRLPHHGRARHRRPLRGERGRGDLLDLVEPPD